MRAVRVFPAVVLLFVACGDPVIPDLPVPAAHVVRMAPAPYTTGIARQAAVTATFSEPVDPATVHEGTLQLFAGAVPVRGDVRVAEDGLSATLTPRAALAFGTEYTAVVGSTVRTRTGATVTGRSWTFETKRNPVR